MFDDDLRISVRLEGGAGDCILSTRLAQAIKDKHPDAKLTAYIDSEGKTFQKEVLNHLFPSFYHEIKIIPNKKYREFWIDSQFGTENAKGFIANVSDSTMAQMSNCDKFIDLHIDSLIWLDNKEFNFLKYFRIFPKPERKWQSPPDKEYILLHLQSTTSQEHRLEKWYIESLIKKIKQKLPNYDIYVISTPEVNHFYNGIDGIHVLNVDIQNVCDYISCAKMMIGADSGFRLIAYCYDIPTLTFSRQCSQPFVCPPSHIVRWLPFPEKVLPLNYSSGFVADLAAKILENPIYSIFPQIKDIDIELIKRNWSVNLDKSVL